MRIVVTAGAVIQDSQGRILLQRRSDYGNWGLPGGAMEPGETIEETMKREIFEETGLQVKEYELYSIYSGARMKYTYPDGNEVVFVMFLFTARTELKGRIAEDGKTLLFHDKALESLQLEFSDIRNIQITEISTVQRPVFEDLKNKLNTLLRT